MPTSTGRLLKSLEAIQFELGEMRRFLASDDGRAIEPRDQRQLRVEIEQLDERAGRLAEWLGEQRFEIKTN